MDRKAITCPDTASLEVIDYERTSLGTVITGCTRFSGGEVRCACECARRLDRHARADNDDPTERVLVVYARSREPAETLAHALRTDDFTVELADAQLPNPPPPEDYDAVVLVAQRGWLGGTSEIDAYVRDHGDGLNGRLARVFSVPRTASRRSLERRATAFAHLLADEIPATEYPVRP